MLFFHVCLVCLFVCLPDVTESITCRMKPPRRIRHFWDCYPVFTPRPTEHRLARRVASLVPRREKKRARLGSLDHYSREQRRQLRPPAHLCAMDSLGLGHGRPDTLDPNAHTADWTMHIGMSTAAFCLVVLVLRYLCCAFKGRAVNDTDAPELEEFNNSEGKRERRVDSIRQGKAGRYVSAPPLVAADEPEATAWEGRPKEVRPKKASRKGRAPRTRPL